DRAAHRAGAVQRTLRAPQNLDVVQIVEPDIGLETAAIVGVGAADDRLPVVNSSGGVAGGIDPTDDVFLVARTEILDGQARNLSRDIHERGFAGAVQGVAGNRLDRGGYVQNPLRIELIGGDDNLRQRRGAMGVPIALFAYLGGSAAGWCRSADRLSVRGKQHMRRFGASRQG